MRDVGKGMSSMPSKKDWTDRRYFPQSIRFWVLREKDQVTDSFPKNEKQSIYCSVLLNGF